MRRKHQQTGAVDQFGQLRPGLRHECGVDGSDAFVEKQDLRLNGRDHTERQTHAHTGGVSAQRHVQVIAEFGEFCDFVELGFHLLARLPQEQATDDDVFQAGDLRVHADTEVEHRSHTPAHIGGTARGLIDSRQ